MKYYPVPNLDPPEPVEVAVKWVRGQRAIDSLRREALMYDGPLADLQGTVVPIFGGFFTGTVQEGYHVGCLILEWCPQNDHTTFGKPTEEELRLRMHAVHELHAAGVYHGQLYERSDSLCMSDGRHFLRAADGTMRIVDFQHAYRHSEFALASMHHQAALEGTLRDIPWNPL
ncbi:hypothetical protein BD311DRAFT_649746 [Dichomitus squalens]|uniref:Protein kinase domain-containing protein n=1 Tax=Dichomitus squalens TaxID=114155 RepID=A0A4Q9N5U6_9APHY|nr:hypothetical protein BD311DRAFT_649746 [Dichomitus squalens]